VSGLPTYLLFVIKVKQINLFLSFFNIIHHLTELNTLPAIVGGNLVRLHQLSQAKLSELQLAGSRVAAAGNMGMKKSLGGVLQSASKLS
jgi:hypothetical protein